MKNGKTIEGSSGVAWCWGESQLHVLPGGIQYSSEVEVVVLSESRVRVSCPLVVVLVVCVLRHSKYHDVLTVPLLAVCCCCCCCTTINIINYYEYSYE